MDALLAKLIDQLNSSVFTLLALLMIAFWIVYKFGGLVKTFSDFKDKHKEMDTHIGGIKDLLASIKATTDLLFQAHIQTIQTKSPLTLSPLGVAFSRELNLEEKIAYYWHDIRKDIQKASPTNPYDVQIITMEIAHHCFENLFTSSEQAQIKLFAYQKGIHLLQIFPIIGVLIRDKYLEEKVIA